MGYPDYTYVLNSREETPTPYDFFADLKIPVDYYSSNKTLVIDGDNAQLGEIGDVWAKCKRAYEMDGNIDKIRFDYRICGWVDTSRWGSGGSQDPQYYEDGMNIPYLSSTDLTNYMHNGHFMFNSIWDDSDPIIYMSGGAQMLTPKAPWLFQGTELTSYDEEHFMVNANQMFKDSKLQYANVYYSIDGYREFYNCQYLQRVDIGWKSGSYHFSQFSAGEMFKNCPNLTYVGTVEFYGGSSSGMFNGCTSLDSISVGLGRNMYSVRDMFGPRDPSLPMLVVNINNSLFNEQKYYRRYTLAETLANTSVSYEISFGDYIDTYGPQIAQEQGCTEYEWSIEGDPFDDSYEEEQRLYYKLYLPEKNIRFDIHQYFQNKYV